MQTLDWVVMVGTLGAIVLYGIYHTRKQNSVESYLMGDRDLKWYTIGLSVMATQASAITFLSTPGLAYESGMGFAQFYFGLPIAMIFLCIFVLPLYYKLKVYTAYEYLESRFDLRIRTLTAILFLVQRGLAAGITIYAPSIILSSVMGWDLDLTIFINGIIVILYTVLGGTKAVSVTQMQQMIVILAGMLVASIILLDQLPEGVGFIDAVDIAGNMGKMTVVDFSFDLNNKYTFWTGILGGTFLFLSYFGTDQSQVQRYLTGRSLKESRLGLLFNAVIKVPMQFSVLFVGILVFIFFLFEKPPIHFNQANLEMAQSSPLTASKIDSLEGVYDGLFIKKEAAVNELLLALDTENEQTIAASTRHLDILQKQDLEIREEVRTLIELSSNNDAKTEDHDYIFITFVTNYLPVGLVGLLLAVIFSAAMSSTASEINALATTTVIDLYKRSIAPNKTDKQYLIASKGFTVLWGFIALFFAVFADLFENLIEAVNMIGSLFYGVILGVFMVAFFLKKIGGKAVFQAAIIGQAIIFTIAYLAYLEVFELAYLWLNPIGCFLVMGMAYLLQFFNRDGVLVE